LDELLKKLDLVEFIDGFKQFFAREKHLAIEGDINLHYRYIGELDKLLFKPPPKVAQLANEMALLKKFAVLPLSSIYEILKVISYFNYLKTLKWEGGLGEWLSRIEIDEEVLLLGGYFDENGALKKDSTPEIESLHKIIEHIKADISSSLKRTISSSKLQHYLVDRQVHLIDGNECLLVRGGFSVVLEGKVLHRSASGYFYVLPENLNELKRREANANAKKEEEIYKLQKSISTILHKKVPYIAFLDREFDRFDHYQARVNFAREKNYDILLPQKGNNYKIVGFKHPALHNPKPLEFEFSKSVLLVTGANAGGKTMFLKSMLTVALLAKYLIPMSIDKKSQVPLFKEIIPIIEDPQNSKNDISTFAGRMREFSALFGSKNFLVGVDEIELGTDSDEASALFKAILEELIKRDVKIVITTHHKRLAALMSDNAETELAAALFDEEKQAPSFRFLKGIIGKSYAFETALRYGIPYGAVSEARRIYGEDKERLNELIQNSYELERDLREKTKALEEEIERVRLEKERIKEDRDRAREEYKKRSLELESEYKNAIEAAKEAVKKAEPKEIHRLLNSAHSKYKMTKIEEKPAQAEQFVVGDSVKYRGKNGEILRLSKNRATIEVEGLKLSVSTNELKKSGVKKKESGVYFKILKPENADITIDLHGLRSDEAIERLDIFLSNALLAGFEEVVVYHGIGTGKLAYAIREFLEAHPKVVSFEDAPLKLGGYGAKLVRL